MLAETAALAALSYLSFDFLSDEVLASLHNLADRSLLLRRARFSGSKQHLSQPEEVPSELRGYESGFCESLKLGLDV